ncbi:MAG: nucleotidyl transferase AbiEii/AbiGii toxin family protein [Chromatiaceae bacterium]|nr:nucleotidyl transferase AbiEii/AbiGii toxin family protein [Chromatiaceae bacterium]MCF7996167.1 nucleotidyl transferase AbiEii/AbiGii toxin family protein [Chromatiaceae bacterium]MCF8015040.1 nucleotidyl transferase AbiEii/AbiGii toxin family protein [Chromatiaceae bacterium]
MFERPHHRRILQLLEMMDDRFLADAGCCFGGGTCAALLLDEYRESVDIDFLCASGPGYRQLRSTVTNQSLGALFRTTPQLMRDVRADRYGIRTVLEIDNTPIKFEIVLEARIQLGCERVPQLPIPVLDRTSQIAEKLLANSDRGADRGTCARDAIDLIMMFHHWGEPRAQAWEIAERAYGPLVRADLEKTLARLAGDPAWLTDCLSRLQVKESARHIIRSCLSEREGLPVL